VSDVAAGQHEYSSQQPVFNNQMLKTFNVFLPKIAHNSPNLTLGNGHISGNEHIRVMSYTHIPARPTSLPSSSTQMVLVNSSPVSSSITVTTFFQGLALVRISAQLRHLLWDALGYRSSSETKDVSG